MIDSIIRRYKSLLSSVKDMPTQDAIVTKHLADMQNNSTYLWADLSNFENSATITHNYRRILEIALSYAGEGSKYYGDKTVYLGLIYALDFMHEHHYGKKNYYGNWWDFEIGTPLILLKILFLVDTPNMCSYLDDIAYYQPDPYMSGLRANGKRPYSKSVGANRVDTVKIAVLLSTLCGDNCLLETAKEALVEVFRMTVFSTDAVGEERDGLYKDFSFIQHGDIAYTGTYGNVLITGIAEIFYITANVWELSELSNVQNIFDMVEKSFMPIIHDLQAMDMVNGRGATRKEFQSVGFGAQIVSAIILLSLTAPKAYAQRYKSFAKSQLLGERFDIFLSNVKSKYIIEKALSIVFNEDIIPMPKTPHSYAFNYMKRLVSVRENFTFALALNSKYIRPYEYMLEENKQGYYTSDGAYRIYTDSIDEYTNNFVATINPYKIAGATIKDTPIPDGSLYYCSPSDNVFVMSVDDYYGVASYELDKRKTLVDGSLVTENGVDTYAKKSYFVLDDYIVALGSDIKGEDVKTYIDTRKIPNNNCTLTISSYMYFRGCGYISKYPFVYEEYTENRSYYDVNSAYDDEKITQNYASLYLNHNEQNNYEYAIFPVSKREYLKNASLTYQTLENSDKLQAITYKNMIFANFWTAYRYSFIETDGALDICINENEDNIELSLIGNCTSVTLYKDVAMVVSSNSDVTIAHGVVVVDVPYNEKINVKLKKR